MTVSEYMVQYRVKVGELIRDNPTKYPTINEALDLSKLNGTFVEVANGLMLVMDSSFHENMPIAECARRIEAVCQVARNNAMALYAALHTDEKVH